MTRAADKISELMVADVVTFRPASLVREAIETMVNRNIGCVVVVKEEQPVGIFTERDALRGLLGGSDVLGRRLEDVMSSPVVTTPSDVDVHEAFEVMADRGFRRLPVVDQNRLVGIVTENDLLRWVRDIANE